MYTHIYGIQHKRAKERRYRTVHGKKFPSLPVTTEGKREIEDEYFENRMEDLNMNPLILVLDVVDLPKVDEGEQVDEFDSQDERLRLAQVEQLDAQDERLRLAQCAFREKLALLTELSHSIQDVDQLECAAQCVQDIVESLAGSEVTLGEDVDGYVLVDHQNTSHLSSVDTGDGPNEALTSRTGPERLLCDTVMCFDDESQEWRTEYKVDGACELNLKRSQTLIIQETC